MTGTKIGAAKAVKTNRERHGLDFYAKIGRIGGENGRTGGFAANRELAARAGRKGGKISKRGKESTSATMVEHRRDSILYLYGEGLSIPQISKRLKLSEYCLRKWAHDNIENYGKRWQ